MLKLITKFARLSEGLAHARVFSRTKKTMLGIPRPSTCIEKHAMVHRHVKEEEVEIGSCARVLSYLAQVQND